MAGIPLMGSPQRLPSHHKRKGPPSAPWQVWLTGIGVLLLVIFIITQQPSRRRRRVHVAPPDGLSGGKVGGVKDINIFAGTTGDNVAERAFAMARTADERQAAELEPIQDMFAGAQGALAAEALGAEDDERGAGENELMVEAGADRVSGGFRGPCSAAGPDYSEAYEVLPQEGVNSASRQEREWWWGGIVALGHQQPYGSVGEKLSWELDLKQTMYNQNNPILVSNKGRYLWVDRPRKVYGLEDGTLCVAGPWERGEEPGTVSSSVVLGEGYGSLREAFKAAAAAHFPPTGRIPDELLFTAPQYNLWIECNYWPTQEKVLDYAKTAIAKGFPPGVLMIDTNWAMYYGSHKFDAYRFPDPKAMISELHQMGFKVMLWVAPFISPDSPEFRYGKRKKYLVKNHWGGVGIPEWWDGHSALLDARNPKAVAWYRETVLEKLTALGVDGFKFDGGDPDYYRQLGGEAETLAMDHTKAFGELGLSHNLSEYRACYKLAGTHLVQRLSDKSHTWNNHGLGALLPNGIAMGLAGYAYTCPDMIGGGQYTDFYDQGTLEPRLGHFDQELFVRYAQASALFPMMQFSLAPWRMLDDAHLEAVLDAASTHAQVSERILQLAREASKTGEPILRSMEYVFPNQGYAEVRDQFMLGDHLMVAPVVTKGYNSRQVRFPQGKWAGQGGAAEEDHVQGPSKVWVDGVGHLGSPITELMWFVKIDD